MSHEDWTGVLAAQSNILTIDPFKSDHASSPFIMWIVNNWTSFISRAVFASILELPKGGIAAVRGDNLDIAQWHNRKSPVTTTGSRPEGRPSYDCCCARKSPSNFRNSKLSDVSAYVSVGGRYNIDPVEKKKWIESKKILPENVWLIISISYFFSVCFVCSILNLQNNGTSC